MSNEARIMELAQRARDTISVVHGIAAARINQSESDAALLIQRYLQDAEADGISPIQAWTTLFSASMITLGDAIEMVAEQSHRPPQQVLAAMALTFQMERT